MEPNTTAAVAGIEPGAQPNQVWVSNMGAENSADNEKYLKWAKAMTKEHKSLSREQRQIFNSGEDVPTKLEISDFIRAHYSGPTTGLGVAREYARMGFRQVSEDLKARAAKLGFTLEHLAVTIGTVIHGVDLKTDPSEEVIKFIHDMLMERKMVGLRSQDITVDQLVAFGHRFGPLDAFPFADHVRGEPFALRLVTDNPKKPQAANLWHTDVTWMEKPSLGSMIHMKEVPPVGGDTLFADSHAAFLGLPVATRKKILGVHCPHDWRIFRRTQEQMGMKKEWLDGLAKEIPMGVMQPLVRTHPETGKQGLYVNPTFIRYEGFVGGDGREWSKEECESVINTLLVQHAKPEYQCRFKWEPNSIAFWDNRSVCHYGNNDFWPHRRVGHRITLSGDKPYYDPKVGDDAPKMADLFQMSLKVRPERANLASSKL